MPDTSARGNAAKDSNFRLTDVEFPMIRLNSTGPFVVQWQKFLNLNPASGTFDKGTEAATKAWQKAKSIKVDGVVGPLTWKTANIKPGSMSISNVNIGPKQGVGIAGGFVAGTLVAGPIGGIFGAVAGYFLTKDK